MGPAILLCPSSSAAHPWHQALPSLKPKQKEGSLSTSPRCFAIAGDLTCRPPFFLYSAFPVEKCRKYIAWRRVTTAAAASEVSVEEASIQEAVAVGDAGGGTEQSAANSEQSVSTGNEEATPAPSLVPTERTQGRRTSRSNSKKNIVVSPAELVPGAQFSGKVVSIQSFGAFVDFGAFTNGLAHISRLSRNYVKKVEDVVQIGQEVKAQILEVDFEANRISLMLVGEEEEQSQQEEVGKTGEAVPDRASQPQTRAPRRTTSRRPPVSKDAASTKLKKDEVVVGTVKNIIKSGVFISLPDGNDGYLPAQEVIFKVPNTGLETQFRNGEEVTVRVLRVERGRISLTMKKEANFDKLNEDLNKGVIGMATNPFELAFRRNEVIASYLAERDKLKVQGESEEVQKVQAESEEGLKSQSESMEGLKVQAKSEEGLKSQSESMEGLKVQAESEEGLKSQSESMEEVKEEAVVGTD
ncbi:hypothetical protein L7F22_037379 [Adiantum nelumboides]|nr:hypothetical protein [Adiantum nelumboides]